MEGALFVKRFNSPEVEALQTLTKNLESQKRTAGLLLRLCMCGYGVHYDNHDRAYLYRIIYTRALALSASARAGCIRRGFCKDRTTQPAHLHYLFSTCLNCFSFAFLQAH